MDGPPREKASLAVSPFIIPPFIHLETYLFPPPSVLDLHLDLEPRPNKYGHAAVWGLVPGYEKKDGTRHYPVAAMYIHSLSLRLIFSHPDHLPLF